MCRKCGSGYSIEDELHVVFECSAMDGLRAEYAESLFSCIPGGLDGAATLSSSGVPTDTGRIRHCGAYAASHMRVFMNQHPSTLASFIHRCLTSRDSMWDYAPYLEPIGGQPQYPDMLESESDDSWTIESSGDELVEMQWSE